MLDQMKWLHVTVSKSNRKRNKMTERPVHFVWSWLNMRCVYAIAAHKLKLRLNQKKMNHRFYIAFEWQPKQCNPSNHLCNF